MCTFKQFYVTQLSLATFVSLCTTFLLSCESEEFRFTTNEGENIPTVHLVVDDISQSWSEIFPKWILRFHVQSDIPVGHDVFVLVRRGKTGGKIVLIPSRHTQSAIIDESEQYMSDKIISKLNAAYGTHGWEQWGNPVCLHYQEDFLAFHNARTAGKPIPRKPRFYKVKNTTTGLWDVVDETGFYICQGYALDIPPGETGLPPYYKTIDMKITLPPAHERAGVLPTSVPYYDSIGKKRWKTLLVEYPFSPYNIGYPNVIHMAEQIAKRNK